MRRDTEAGALRDAAHDAFIAFWRAVDTTEAEVLWLYYCAAQEQYEVSLVARCRSLLYSPCPVHLTERETVENQTNCTAQAAVFKLLSSG
jgi:hypothetical protein